MKTASLQVSELSLPGDWRQIQASPEVVKMAASIETHGQLEPGIVRASDKKLLVGRTRAAACEKLGIEFRCLLVDCSDLEGRIMERVENAHRRHDPEKQRTDTLELIELMAQKIRQEYPDLKERGPKKTARGLAIETVATIEGVKPESIRMREWRANKGERFGKAEGLKSLGMVIDRDFENRVKEIQARHAKLVSRLQGALIIYKNLLKADDSLDSDAPLPGKYKLLYWQLDDLAKAIGRLAPFSLCPFCKGLEAVKPSCAGCETFGWVSRQQLSEAPLELHDEEHPHVLYRGNLVPVSALPVTAPTEPAPEPADDSDEPPGDDEDAWPSIFR